MTEFCFILFFGLTHIFLQFKKKQKQRSLLPPSALPKLSRSFPQVHKTIKYPLKWKKRRGFLYFKSQVWEHLWGWLFREDLICHLSNYTILHEVPRCLQQTSLLLAEAIWDQRIHLIDTGEWGLRALFCKWILLVLSRRGLRGVSSFLAKHTL